MLGNEALSTEIFGKLMSFLKNENCYEQNKALKVFPVSYSHKGKLHQVQIPGFKHVLSKILSNANVSLEQFFDFFIQATVNNEVPLRKCLVFNQTLAFKFDLQAMIRQMAEQMKTENQLVKEFKGQSSVANILVTMVDNDSYIRTSILSSTLGRLINEVNNFALYQNNFNVQNWNKYLSDTLLKSSFNSGVNIKVSQERRFCDLKQLFQDLKILEIKNVNGIYQHALKIDKNFICNCLPNYKNAADKTLFLNSNTFEKLCHMLTLLHFRASASKKSNVTFVTCTKNQNYLETLFVPVLFKCLLVLMEKEKAGFTISDLKILINISYITHQYTLLPNTFKEDGNKSIISIKNQHSLVDDYKKYVSDSYQSKYDDESIYKNQVSLVAVSLIKLEFLDARLIKCKEFTKSKTTAFQSVLYNYTRIKQILMKYKEAEKEKYYPDLPSLSNVNFSLINSHQELTLIDLMWMSYDCKLQHLSVSLNKDDSLNLKHFHPSKVVSYLEKLSNAVSSFYKNNHVLVQNLPHQIPLLHARVYLLKCCLKIFEYFFNLLIITPTDQM